MNDKIILLFDRNMDNRIKFSIFVKIFSLWIILLQIIEIPSGGFCLFKLGLPLERCDLDGLLNGIIYFWYLLIISNCCYSIYCIISIILIWIWRKSIDNGFSLNFFELTVEDSHRKRSIHKKIFVTLVTCTICICMSVWVTVLDELDHWLMATHISTLLFNTFICSYLYRCDFKSTPFWYANYSESSTSPFSSSDDEESEIVTEKKNIVDRLGDTTLNYLNQNIKPISRTLKGICKMICAIILLYNMIHIIYDALETSLRKSNPDMVQINLLYMISFLVHRVLLVNYLIDVV